MRRLLTFLTIIYFGATVMAAVKVKSKTPPPPPAPDPATFPIRAYEAFYAYDFDSTLIHIAAYEAAMQKAKLAPADSMMKLKHRAELAASMLDRVEQVVIVDSITVDKANFFRAYHLSPESGSIQGRDALPPSTPSAPNTSVYHPETDQYMMWAITNPTDKKTILVSASQLYNNTWEEASPLSGNALSMNGNSNYPFMMADGVTLYYANDGDESIGGYDIFITRRGDDGNYLQPQNIGMPYNSPYDDYLMAIDELSGIGWWATDRNQLGDSLTIYKFIPSELRHNFPPDTPTLADKARITNIRSTWAPDADYSHLLRNAKALGVDTTQPHRSFRFALPGGRVATSLDDFDLLPRARRAMEDYLDRKAEMTELEQSLADLRAQYRAGSTEVAAEIRSQEKRLETMRNLLRSRANEVVKAAQ